jgi:hypothetical protein
LENSRLRIRHRSEEMEGKRYKRKNRHLLSRPRFLDNSKPRNM